LGILIADRRSICGSNFSRFDHAADPNGSLLFEGDIKMNRKTFYAAISCVLALCIGAQATQADERRYDGAAATSVDRASVDRQRADKAASDRKLAAIHSNRAYAVQDIMSRLLPSDARVNTGYQFEANLNLASSETLLAISNTYDFNEAVSILLYGSLGSRGSASMDVSKLAIGDATGDYVYTAVTPCRIVDTRPGSGGSGAISSGTSQDFYV
jgi:hypothetical protein